MPKQVATTQKTKKNIISTNQSHKKDTGSAPVQIALLTSRIEQLTEHLKLHKKDFHSRLWLVRLAAKRRKLLDYLKLKDKEKYQSLVDELNIRVQKAY